MGKGQFKLPYGPQCLHLEWFYFNYVAYCLPQIFTLVKLLTKKILKKEFKESNLLQTHL